MSNYCTKEFTLTVAPALTWAITECTGFVYDLNFTGAGYAATWTPPDCRENIIGGGYSQWLFCVDAKVSLGPFDNDKLITVSGTVTLTCPPWEFYPFPPFVSIGWSYLDGSMTGLVGYSGNEVIHAEDPPAPDGSGTYPIALSGTLTAGLTTLLWIRLDGGGPPSLAPTKPQTSGSITISVV